MSGHSSDPSLVTGPWQRMPWSYQNITDLQDTICGIYSFWCRHNRRCIYIGQAVNIGKRLKDHWRGSHNATLWKWIKAFGRHLDVYYAEVSETSLNAEERRLIEKYHPEANDTFNPTAR